MEMMNSIARNSADINNFYICAAISTKTNMKKLLFVFSLALSLNYLSAQDLYSRVKIYANHAELQALASEGLLIDHGIFKAGAHVTCELSSGEMAILEQSGLRYEILIEDVTAFYVERNAPYLDRLDELKRAAYELSREWPVPEGFELGPVGGFLTIDQALSHLDNMAAQYPDLISPKYTLDNQTHNNRPVYWVRLSDNPTVNEDEPEILYTGMIHAREAIGMQLLIFYMYHLLENYATDPDVQYIVDNFELYFVPIVNMDGYAYNIQLNPAGGGMWRKNRSQNSDGSYGVDINRNFAYMWGYNNSGSSPVPSDDTYRGPSAASEPETQNLQNFCEQNEFVIALNYHSYSDLLLYPWGWSSTPCAHDAIFNAHAKIMTKENGYTYGPGNTTIYATNGGSDDWMYGEQTTKDLIYSYTPEVGDGSAGFWPPVSQIIPLCQENMWQNIMAAKLAGPWATVRDLSPSIMENTSGALFFDIQRLGLQDGATYTVSIQPLDDNIAAISDPLAFADMDILETASGAFTYTLREGIQGGEKVRYLLTMNNGIVDFSDTITKIYGTPVVIFSDSASTFEKWTSVKWNVTSVQYHSPDKSIADSPTGNYTNYENNVMVLKDPIDLSEAVYAVLSFWAKWDIEPGYDYVQVMVSDNNGGTWTAMNGKYTKLGNSNQAYNQPLYDGVQSSWVKEEIDLSQYLDKEIKIRFVLRSDTYVTADGFYWDDMAVTIVDVATGVQEPLPAGSSAYVSVQPNPAGGPVSLVYALDNGYGPYRLSVVNAAGMEVYKAGITGGEGVHTFNVADWNPGLYYYAILSSRAVVASGKLLVTE